MREQGISGWLRVRTGSCRAWLLPSDETCAAVARRLVRESVADLGLEPGVLDDAILMTSELAANTLHATAAARNASPARGKADSGDPELWLYLRGVGLRRELVCKVFDCYQGWLNGPPPSRFPQQPEGQDISGRGLRIVHELSAGQWGHHPTRARLAGWGLRGKAVWFAVPAPLAHARLADATGLRAYTRSADVTAARRYERISARQAARELLQMLNERGVSGARLSGPDEPGADMSVLAVRGGLALWCRSGSVSLTCPEGPRERWHYTDLVEAAERTIWLYEQLEDRPQALITA
jgi:hypothetical protein